MELIQFILLYIADFINIIFDALSIFNKESALKINNLVFIGFQREIC